MKKSVRFPVMLAITLAAFSQAALAVVYPLPPAKSRLVGENLTITVPADNKQPLEAFAAQYQMGLSNMLEANPRVDVYLPKPGTVLTIPHQLILPDAPREGIVINSAEMRLYYYPKGSQTVVVLPIGIGQLGKDTPINWITQVEHKKDGPTWTPTPKMHEEYAARGETLPAVFPAGPNNPMGLYALYVGRLYAIHGTNANFGIGLRVSHGCVRLRADDIKWLFDNVPIGTRVQFIDQPIKATIEPDGTRYVEIHHPLSVTEEQFNSAEPVPLEITPAITKIVNDASVSQRVLNNELKDRTGMPVKISGIDENTETAPVTVPDNHTEPARATPPDNNTLAPTPGIAAEPKEAPAPEASDKPENSQQQEQEQEQATPANASDEK